MIHEIIEDLSAKLLARGLKCTRVSSLLEPSFMLTPKQLEEIAATVQGIPVRGCLPGSTAAEAGVRYGDIVLAVNGMLTPTIDEYIEARALRKDGYELRLFRAGEELTVFVPFRAPVDTMEALAEQIADGRFVSPEMPGSSPPKSAAN